MGFRVRFGTSQRIGRRTRMFEGVGLSKRGITPYAGVGGRMGRHVRWSASKGKTLRSNTRASYGSNAHTGCCCLQSTAMMALVITFALAVLVYLVIGLK